MQDDELMLTLLGRRKAAYSPAALEYWLDPSDLSSMRQETTGASATTAAAVNSPVGSIRNKGTVGGWLTAPDNASRPVLRQDGSRFYLEMTSSRALRLASGVTLSANYFLAWASRKDVADGTGVILGADSGQRWAGDAVTASGAPSMYTSLNAQTPSVFTNADALTDHGSILSVRASNVEAWFNGALGGYGAAGDMVINGLTFAGANTFRFTGRLYQVAFGANALSNADLSNLAGFLNDRSGAGANRSTNSVIVFDGNSLTSGSGSTGGQTYPAQALALLGSGWTGHNTGVSGATTVDRFNATPAQIYPRRLTTSARAVCVCWEITNDLYFGTTAAQAQTNYQFYCNRIRGAGFKVIAMTVLPRSNSGTPGNFETSRQTVNTWLRANWTAFADGFYDVAADSRIGDAGDETNTTFYADLVHLTNAGYAIVAAGVAAVAATI